MKAVFQSFKAKAIGLIQGVSEERTFAVANSLRTHILISLSNDPPRTGRTYRVPGTNVFYTASSPGEYPALATGELRKSVAKAGVSVTKGFGGVRASFNPGVAPHGIELEKGLRPWFSKAAAEKQADMEAQLKRKWF
jgi:hypothetical protein